VDEDNLPVLPSRPHSIAKTEILSRYLKSWFFIHGQSSWCRGIDLYYLDAFAGPGKHEKGEPGSPIIALQAVEDALSALSARWMPRSVKCIFVEKNRANYEAVRQRTSNYGHLPNVEIYCVRGDIERILPQLQLQFPSAFSGQSPIFSFLDPFGPTDLPFHLVSELIQRPRTEALINFNHVGLARILKDEDSPASIPHIVQSLGTSEWHGQVNAQTPFNDAANAFLETYKTNIRKHADHVFAFKMSTPWRKVSDVGYYLVFASQHVKGLEKMKEAMKTVGQGDKYEFANARIGYQQLFSFTDPSSAAQALHGHFQGRMNVSLREIEGFVLNETEYIGPTQPLKYLEQRGLLKVNASSPARRRNSYPPDKVASISFSGKEDPW